MARLGLTEPRGIFRVTFETITAESAELGDAAERGWLDFWGAPVDEPESSEWDLRDLLNRFAGYPETYGDGDRIPRWITVSPGSDFWLDSWWRDLAGADALAVDCSVHRPDWITDASWIRVCRMLGWRWRY
ncbi:hypothetical protein EBT31_08950 [bacterium]|nr:hypothetical protein [bacterium]